MSFPQVLLCLKLWFGCVFFVLLVPEGPEFSDVCALDQAARISLMTTGSMLLRLLGECDEDFALLISQHLSTRDIFALPTVCSALRSLASTKGWRGRLGHALCPEPFELAVTLHRAALDRSRQARYERIDEVHRKLNVAQRRRPRIGYPHPLTPNAADSLANRGLGFASLSPGLEPTPAALLPYRAYLAAVTAHPPPLRSQLVAFANYLCRAHSWYKHLPPPPGAPFYVFFHPAVMMSRSSGRPAVEITTQNIDRYVHYSVMCTRDYRHRHSICDWSAPERDTDRLPPHIYDVDGSEMLLPPRVSSGADSMVYLSSMCFDGYVSRDAPLRAEPLRASAAALTESARLAHGLADSPAASLAASRLLSLAQDVEGVEGALAQLNGAPIGATIEDAQKRRELLGGICDKQMRSERAAIVDALVRQAEAIWGVALPPDESE